MPASALGREEKSSRNCRHPAGSAPGSFLHGFGGEDGRCQVFPDEEGSGKSAILQNGGANGNSAGNFRSADTDLPTPHDVVEVSHRQQGARER